MGDPQDFQSLSEGSVYVELSGETKMLLGRWIHSVDDQPLAKINLVAHMGPKTESGGGLSVDIRYSVDVFVAEGWRERDGERRPNWIIRLHQEPGDWDSDMLANCARLARDPVFDLYRQRDAVKVELQKRAGELAAYYDGLILSGAIPKPAELSSGKTRPKWL